MVSQLFVGCDLMFQSRLRELRKERGLTLMQLAKHFNMSHSTLSKYETGHRKPDMEMLKKLSDYFGVSVDYLIGESPVRDKDKTVIINKDTNISDLPPEAVQELENFIKELREKYKNKKK